MNPSPYLRGNFAPLPEELTSTELEVRGELPRELTGRLLRIGPNPIVPRDPYHWFTGNGMVHGIRLREGRALWYRNRWVRDDEVVEARGWPLVPGPRHGMGGNTVNTHVIDHAGRTLALVEGGGLPVELSYELETLRRSDFDGTLPGGFTAHPKKDPETGELHAITYYWEWDHLKYLVVDPAGCVRRVVEIPVPGGPMVHDLAITEHHVVVFDLPCIFDPTVMEAGGSFPYVWHPEYGARIGLLPRDAGAEEIQWFEIGLGYVFHPLNAYELGPDRLVLDAVRHERVFAGDREGPSEGHPVLTRWSFDLPSGTAKEEPLDDRAIEFPRHDERLVGRRNRIGYAVGFQSGEQAHDFPSLVRYDLEKGSRSEWSPGPGRSPMEPVFVPRTGSRAEDDGWILTLVYDRATDRSEMVVLAADAFGDAPVASVSLPTRVPFGFHGSWVPDPS